MKDVNTGLFIPANPFANVRTFVGTLDDLRIDLDCTLLEFVYPYRAHEALPSPQDSNYILVGDEEARLREHELNWRATMLFGYPYPLAGDMVLFRDNADGIKSIQSDLYATLVKAFINKGEY